LKHWTFLCCPKIKQINSEYAMTKKIVFFNCEDQSDLDVEKKLLGDNADIELVLMNDQKDIDIIDVCKDADGVITIYSPFDRNTLNNLDRLQVIVNQAIGFDNIDLDAATEKGICAANVPDFCVHEVATHSVGLMLDCARRITELSNQTKGGAWEYRDKKMYRLKGQVFGFVAFGNIPKTMVPMLKGLGLKLVVYSPRLKADVCAEYGVDKVNSLEDLLAMSDIVSINCPLTAETENLIGERELKLMKETAILINTARGKVVNEDDLYKALNEGWIYSAGFDVLADEKKHDSKLLELNNFVITPHIAFYSEGSMIDMRAKALNNVLAVIRDKKYPATLLNKDVEAAARFQKA
jgi:D-3-phosphoglycerate dehydrogenase